MKMGLLHKKKTKKALGKVPFNENTNLASLNKYTYHICITNIHFYHMGKIPGIKIINLLQLLILVGLIAI